VAAACTDPDDNRDADQRDLVVVTDAWAFGHHNIVLAAAYRTAFAFVAVVVAVVWDIAVVVLVAAAVLPVELQSFVTTHLRPPRSVAVAVENLPPKWFLLLVRLLHSSCRKQAVGVVLAVVAACDAVVAFAVPFLRTDTEPDTVDSSCASFLARERERKQASNKPI
jgi:hypothetical protein